MKLIDLTLQTNSQSRALLNFLSDVDIDSDKEYFNTATWYNGREKGFVIYISNMIKNKQLNIAFAEVRNTDQIFVCSWETKTTLNPPILSDCNEEAYRNRMCFKNGQFSEATNYIIKIAKEFCNNS